jgi:hypothetical protein
MPLYQCTPDILHAACKESNQVADALKPNQTLAELACDAGSKRDEHMELLQEKQHTCSIYLHIQCVAIQGPHSQQHDEEAECYVLYFSFDICFVMLPMQRGSSSTQLSTHSSTAADGHQAHCALKRQYRQKQACTNIKIGWSEGC